MRMMRVMSECSTEIIQEERMECLEMARREMDEETWRGGMSMVSTVAAETRRMDYYL